MFPPLTECTPGVYGPGCNQTCDCVYSRSCDRITGACTCLSGYYGDTCNQSKSKQCTIILHLKSDNIQSSTDFECSSDLLTNDITCSACQVGYFGEGCTQQCVCSNNADCDHISGECRCKSGWRGHFCDKGKIINSIDSSV